MAGESRGAIPSTDGQTQGRAEMARMSKVQKIWKISSEKCPTHLFGFGAARYFAFWSSLRQPGLVSGLVSGLGGYFWSKRTRTGVLCEVIIRHP